MTPGQLRQHAAQRFTSVNKQDWADKAVQGLRDAADVIERMDLASVEAHATCQQMAAELITLRAQNATLASSAGALWRETRAKAAA